MHNGNRCNVIVINYIVNVIVISDYFHDYTSFYTSFEKVILFGFNLIPVWSEFIQFNKFVWEYRSTYETMK